MAIRIPCFYGVLMLALAAVVAGGAGCSSDPTPPAPPGQTMDPVVVPQINVVSSRADLVSGGDALVEIVLPAKVTIDKLHVTLGNGDVTSAFASRADGRILGLVHGLADGGNRLTANVGGSHNASLTITNHPIGGPVISGAQVTPFVCATPTARPEQGNTPATNASGLSTLAIDAQCNIATEVTLFYRTSTPGCMPVRPDPGPPGATPCFKPYDLAMAPPADLAMTTTTTGVTVPYIVRVERGTMNRGIYELVVLFDPKANDVKTGWTPFAPQPAWNGKVVYSFGASSGQPRQQFRSEQVWSDNDAALAGGFLVAINSMTDSLYNSNRVSMSETVMMMKEKIIKSYGAIKYVIGNGCSGGSINQLTTASIFPGLLDGIQPTCTYPDAETTGIEVADCTLLVNFYNSSAWKALTNGESQDAINKKKAAINGHVDQTGCHAWVNLFSNLGRPGNYVPVVVTNDVTGATGSPSKTKVNNCNLPASMVYDPANNPTGVRCSGADHAVAVFGKVPGTSHARTTGDNVGVQYGLEAFLSHMISGEEFVTLNEKIGGVDFDSEFTSGRTVADVEALGIAYRAGMVSDAHHLANTAIIDLRGNDDSRLTPKGAFGIHHEWRSFALRARLDDANGNHDNHVMWRYGTSLLAPPASGLTLEAFLAMDTWLGAVKADTSGASLATKISSHKPADAVDFCFLASDTLFSTKVTDAAACDADPTLKPHASPRQVAGGPLAENILKCQLRPVVRADYTPGLTNDEFARLKAVFPDGVCDFTKPGVGQVPAESPLTFEAGPGGTVLPDPPKPVVQ